MPEAVRELARAKLNARLRVLGRDSAGFHALETIFLRLELADEVELEPGADGIRLEVEGARPGVPPARVDLGDVPRGPDNLCWRAARLFYDAVGEDPGVSIRLLKRIPAAGGLGGGSADAAAVLRGLARLHDDPPPDEELMAVAGEVGSDVPFALLDRPMALGWERGRRLMPLEPPPPRPMLLLVPQARVSTPEAFRWLDEDRGGAGGSGAADDGDGGAGEAGRGGADPPAGRRRAGALPPARELDRWEALLAVGVNDFETSVFARLPELGWWKEELLGEGADAAMLCGSGSTLCGIFGESRRRDAVAARLREGTEVDVVTTEGPV